MLGMAALLGALGVVAIAFGLLQAVMALIQPVMDSLWIFGNLLLGVVLLAVAVFMRFDDLTERMRSGEARRAGKYGSSAILGALLGLAILASLGFLSVRYTHRFDVSEAGVHTLSQQSIELVEGLEQSVFITAFFNESEAPPIRDLLDRYAYASDRIELRFLDPNSVPGLVDELGLSTDELARGIVRIELESGEATKLSEFTEPQITNALLKLVRSTGKKVYFVSGHNERTIEAESGAKTAFAAGPDSFGQAAAALVNDTYEVEALLLATLADVPEDASAVIVAGPTRPFLPAELAALQRYVEAGGALFVTIDPRAHTNLYDLLSSWGVRLGDDVIVDRASAVFGQPTTLIAREYDATHPITSLFLHEPSMFPAARSIELDPAAADDYTILTKTGPESWAERDLETWRSSGRAEYGPEDLRGPVPVAVAGSPRSASRVEPEGEGDGQSSVAGRIVVFGDSDFATNEYLDVYRNRDLFVNSLNWLAGDVEQIAVRPNVARASSFAMSQAELRRIQYLSLLVLPEAIAVFGVVGWWLRRRAA